MEELADDSKFHHQSLDVDYEVSIYHPSRLARRQRRIAHPNISTLNFRVRTKQLAKKNTTIFFGGFFQPPFWKKKGKLKKLDHLPPSLQGVKIQSEVVDPFGPAFVSPKKCHSFTTMTSHHPSEKATRSPTHPPQKKHNTQAAGEEVVFGNAKRPKRTKKRCPSFAWWKILWGMFLSPKGWLNWCNLQASPLFISKFPLQKQKKLDKFPPIKVQKQKSGS